MKIAKTVDELLDDIDYSKINGGIYKHTEFAYKYLRFIQSIEVNNPDINSTPEYHMLMLDNFVSKSSKLVNLCFRGSAKAVDINHKVLTPKGFKTMGNIQCGDIVYDRNGKLTEVLHVSNIFHNQTYRITLANGYSYIVNEDHLNIVQRYSGSWKEEVLTTKDLVSKPLFYNRTITKKQTNGRQFKWFIPICNKTLNFDSNKNLFDAYTLGIILGNGNINKKTGQPTITCHKNDFYCYEKNIPHELGKIYTDKRNSNVVNFRIKGENKFFRDNNLWCASKDKFIPNSFLFGSKEDRLALLQGLLDTDGTVSRTGYCTVSFCSKSETLANGVAHLISSLGGYTTKRNRNGFWYIRIIAPHLDLFRLKRKKIYYDAIKSRQREVKRIPIVSIEKVNCLTKCIKVASTTSSYLLENNIITHNTTLFGVNLLLYLAVYNYIPNFGSADLAMFIGCSKEKVTTDVKSNIQAKWEMSPTLQALLPKGKQRFTDDVLDFQNIEGERFSTLLYGANSGIRGTLRNGKRPKIAILDDLITDEASKSPTMMKNIKDVVQNSIIYALDPRKSKTIFNGTPFNKEDPIYEAVESGAWKVNAFPVCNKFPCSKEEFQGAWPERFSYESLLDTYNAAVKENAVGGFNRELMLRIINQEDRLVRDEDIVWFDRDEVLKYRNNYNFYITTDFAVSEKQTADLTVISVWAYSKDKEWLLIDGIAKRQTMDKTINDLFNFVLKYKPLSTGIENTGQQGGLISWVRKEMRTRGIYFPLTKNNNSLGIRPKGDKLSRFNIVTPLFLEHKIKFPDTLKESEYIQTVLNQIRLASSYGLKGKDDALDTISMLQYLKPQISHGSRDSAIIVDNPYNSYNSIWENNTIEKEKGLSNYFV